MAEVHGITTRDIKSINRHGTQGFVQISDGTGTSGNLAKYNTDGSVTDSGVLAASSAGAGRGTIGGTFATGSFYGQVPRGPLNGSNRVFLLDYTLASPFTILDINGIVQKPPRDGPYAYPGPDYAITGNILTYRFALSASDWHYIWYFAGQPADTLVMNGIVPGATAYLTTAHYPNPVSTQWGGGAGFNDTIALFAPHPSWLEDPAQWDKRTNIHALTPLELASLRDGSLYLLLEQYHVGTGVPLFDPPDAFWIYDAYIVETLASGVTQTWRPTNYVVEGVEMADPGNAIDGNPDTYAVLSRGGYATAMDGVFLNLNQWQVIGDNVDLLNGSGNTGTGATGATGTTGAADQLHADMAGSNEGTPHGSSYSGPATISLPAGTQALEWWSNLYVDAAGNPATNSQVAVKNVQMWWYSTSLAQWVDGFGPTNVFDGGYFAENLSGTELAPILYTTQLDGSRAYGTVSGQVAHSLTPFPRVAITASNYGGMVVVAEAQLVLINPAGTDDRATAKLLYGVGVDPYASTTAITSTLPSALASGKLKYVTSTWRSFAATDMTQAALDAHPPPIDLTGIGG